MRRPFIVGAAFISAVMIDASNAWAQRCVRAAAQRFSVEEIPAQSRFAVSLSASGDRVLVGADFGNDPERRPGSAYVFQRDDRTTPTDVSDDVWLMEARLQSPSPRTCDWFGWAVSLDRTQALIGAPSPFDGMGRAFIFVLDDSGTPTVPDDDFWRLDQELVPCAGEDWKFFGRSVAIHGVWAFVSATTSDRTHETVHVFRQSPTPERGATWIHAGALTASDAAVQDLFGACMATDGDRLVVGASLSGGISGNSGPGAAYVFLRTEKATPQDPEDYAWAEACKLTAANPGDLDLFGESCSIAGDRIIVGARGDDGDAGANVGGAYVFLADENATPEDPFDDSWIQESKLVPCDPEEQAQFGTAVSIAGDVAVIGSLKSAYLFERRDGTWLQRAKLGASPAPCAGCSGDSVAIGVDFVLIGNAGTPAGMPDTLGTVFMFPFDPPPAGLACFADFQTCFTGAGIEATSCCRTFTVDDDDVDLLDYQLFWQVRAAE